MNERDTVWEIAVVGAGAAGLMAAIFAAKSGARVLLLDSKEKIGAKILMSGGTRCNLTNEKVTERDYESEQPNLLKAPLRAYNAEQTLRFFESIGVEVEAETGGKFFPVTHSGRTVLEALVKELKKSNVTLKTGCKVTTLSKPSETAPFDLEGDGFHVQARAVVLTTGGLSFPATGSDGTGYKLAKAFGHTLVETSASLTPLLTTDADWKSISGVSLPVKLTYTGAEKKRSYEGSFLFTHFGFSGPVVLNISRHWIRDKSLGKKIRVNFLPDTEESEFRENFLQSIGKSPGKQLGSLLSMGLPTRFVEVFLAKMGLSSQTVLNQLRREDRERLVRELFGYELPVSGDRGYAKAEVTAGGIPLNEVDKNTMESKKQPGLFFAGEILDVDGRIGGFNFQWAWSTGTVAARGAAKFVQVTDTQNGDR